MRKHLWFNLYLASRDVWLQSAVRTSGPGYVLRTMRKLRPFELPFLLAEAVERPEAFVAVFCPELEGVFGGTPGWERVVTLAAASGWPTDEDEVRKEIALLRDAFNLWLAYPPRPAPWLPAEAVEYLAGLKPAQRFLATCPEAICSRGETGIGGFLAAFPEGERWVEIRAEMKGRLQVAGEEPWPQQKGPPASAATLMDHLRATAGRRWLTRYSSPFLLSLAWVELVHHVKKDARGAYCRTCGEPFIPASPNQTRRQVYCSPACRRKADPAQAREAQALYKRFRRGKIPAEEYARLAREKGLPVGGGKRGKLARTREGRREQRRAAVLDAAAPTTCGGSERDPG